MWGPVDNAVGRLNRYPPLCNRGPAGVRLPGFSRTLHRVICWVCGNPVAEFLAFGIPTRPGRCPHCGAKPRNRAVHWYLRQVIRPRLVAASEVLEVGGSRVAVQRFSAEAVIGGARYTVIDRRKLDFHDRLEPPHRFIPMDVTNADFADDSFDVILCNHTLPYIRDDSRALSEIFRCLKTDGLAMLDSSHDEDRTRTVDEYRRQHPQLGDEYFAENGDQWVYGKDYLARVEAAGFTTRVDVLFADCDKAFKREHGLKEHHELIVGFKSPRGEARFSLPTASAAGELT